jgi:diaminopimelate decarboxylase
VVAPISTHLLPTTASITASGRFMVGGLDVVDLADEYGTPAYIYDEWHLRTKCQEAVSAFNGNVTYAMKAFSCMAMARLAYGEGLHLDAASAGEMYTALRAGVPASHIVLHGNNKSTAELTYALEQRIGRIMVDNLDELERLKRLAGFGHPKPNVLIRVTPGVDAHTHDYIATGHEDVKFGVSIASGAAHEAVAMARATDSGVNLVGIHAHVGSQVTQLDSFRQIVARLAEFFNPLGLPELVIGGGLGVPYLNGDTTPSMFEWGVLVREAAREAGVAASVKLGAEPGRSIVANAGFSLYRIGTIKNLPGIREYMAVDGGMSDNIRPMLYGAEYEAFLPRAADAERTRPVRIAGKHCESSDIVIRDAWLPADTKIGDVVAVAVTGAYGHAMASNYNRLPRPPVVFVSDGSSRVVVRRETYDDLVRLDVD